MRQLNYLNNIIEIGEVDGCYIDLIPSDDIKNLELIKSHYIRPDTPENIAKANSL